MKMLLINTVFPIFSILLLGWILAYYKFVQKEISQYLINYVFWVAGPSIVFSSTCHMDLSDLFMWKFVLAYPMSVIVMMAITVSIFYFIFREHPINSINYAYSASIKNTIMIGYPILSSLTGEKAAIPMTISVIFFNCIFTPILVLFYSINQHETQHNLFREVFKNTVCNPFIIAAFLGILFALYRVSLPVSINKIFTYINPSYVPCSLFAIGVELRFLKLFQSWKKLSTLTFISLLVFPIISLFIGKILALSPFYIVALILFSSLPTAKSVYIYAKSYHIKENETAAIISFTTLVSLFTIPIAIVLSHFEWPHVFSIY